MRLHHGDPGMDNARPPGGDWIRHADAGAGIERIEAFFRADAYAMHRHDTYAIGRTLAGVQSFHYRSQLRHSLAGHTIVLHPDEPHDGHAGTDAGFRYRMIYVEPARLQDALGGRPLPFLRDGVSTDPRLFAATQAFVDSVAVPLDALEESDALFDLATALQAVAGAPASRARGDLRAAQTARAFIHDRLAQPVTLDDLAAATGRDRWALSRDFRSFFGTSPYRYLVLRRLELARRRMRAGDSLADSAAAAGFADQSHMTRQFAKAYGVTPGRWLDMQTVIARGGDRPCGRPG